MGYYKLSNNLSVFDVYSAGVKAIIKELKQHGEKVYPDKAKNELLFKVDTEKKKADVKPKE